MQKITDDVNQGASVWRVGEEAENYSGQLALRSRIVKSVMDRMGCLVAKTQNEIVTGLAHISFPSQAPKKRKRLPPAEPRRGGGSL